MVNEFKLTVVHCTPKPDTDLRMRVDLSLDKKLWKIRAGPPGRRAIAGRGPWVAGPWAAGPLGRGPAFSKAPNQKLGDTKRLCFPICLSGMFL